MTRKTMITILIFVILAGAIAGAFIFLNQTGTSAPIARPYVSKGMGGTAAGQSTLPIDGPNGTGFTVSARGTNLSA